MVSRACARGVRAPGSFEHFSESQQSRGGREGEGSVRAIIAARSCCTRGRGPCCARAALHRKCRAICAERFSVEHIAPRKPASFFRATPNFRTSSMQLHVKCQDMATYWSSLRGTSTRPVPRRRNGRPRARSAIALRARSDWAWRWRMSKHCASSSRRSVTRTI